MAITMEYGDRGDLYNVLFTGNNTFYDLKMNEFLDLVRDLFNILVSLEEEEVLHRDIKTENIYIKTVNGSPRFMMGDFGLAETIENARVALLAGNDIGGSYEYAAPEFFHSKEIDSRITPKNDVWSMGVVLFALLRLDLPSVSDTQNFDQDAIDLEIERVKETDSQTIKCLSEDPKTLAFLLELVKQMLCVDLDKRTTGRALLQQLEGYISFT